MPKHFLIILFLILTAISSAVSDVKTGKADILSDFNESLRLNPENRNILVLRGNYFIKRKLYKQALNDFNDYLKSDNKSSEIFLKRGIIHTELKNYNLAKSDFKSSIDLNKDNFMAYLFMGKILLIEKKARESLYFLDIAEKFSSKNLELLKLKGAAYLKLGKINKAKFYFEKYSRSGGK